MPKLAKTLNITDIKLPNYRLVNITQPGEEQISWLKQRFRFHALDYQDCADHAQRPKLRHYDDYTFLALLFPVYNSHHKTITPAEVDFFISSRFLIAVHDDQILPVSEFFSRFNRRRKNNLAPADLLAELLDQLMDQRFRMLDHISLDMSAIEDDIFKPHRKTMTNNLLGAKRNIVNMRRILCAHTTVLKQLLDTHATYLGTPQTRERFILLIAQAKELWALLDIDKETINTLHETNESIITYHTNDIMKTLTMFSVVVFPLTLIAAIFGMNTIHAMPWVNNALGFWYVLGLMVIGTFLMYFYFKKKHWL